MSVTRLRGGNRGDRGESPKRSRSGFSPVYRPSKSNLHDRHSPIRRATSVLNKPSSTETTTSLSLISVFCTSLSDISTAAYRSLQKQRSLSLFSRSLISFPARIAGKFHGEQNVRFSHVPCSTYLVASPRRKRRKKKR